MCGHFPFVHCHSERSEESEVCEWFMCNEFRFFTSLRCVRDDRVGMLDEVLAVDAGAGEEYVGYLPEVG